VLLLLLLLLVVVVPAVANEPEVSTNMMSDLQNFSALFFPSEIGKRQVHPRTGHEGPDGK
jgi:hypothetical protein